MHKPYRLIVFDWEGTLGDTLGQVLNTIEKEATLLNLGEFDKTIANTYISFGLIKVIRKLYPKLSLELQGTLLKAVERSLVTNPKEICLIANAQWFVELLYKKGFMLGLASNKGHKSLQRALQVTDLEKFFSIVRTASQTASKPDPQMLEEIIEEGQVKNSETLMIGDSITDIEMANAIGVPAIGVDFYHRDQEVLKNAGAIEVFDDYRQLASFLHLEGK